MHFLAIALKPAPCCGPPASTSVTRAITNGCGRSRRDSANPATISSPGATEASKRTCAHFPVRDSLLGPHYLMFQEILDPDEPAAQWLHEYHTDMLMKRNVASSQPYYSRHPWIHLKRGEVKAFLKAYYNTLAAQAD